MSEGLLNGLLHSLLPGNLLLIFAGTALGILFGAMPGLTATMGLALLVPFTFGMDPSAGLIMLAGIYVGAMYADAIPAILINTPGTPAAIATTFDGYPLAKKGKATYALSAAFTSSTVNGLLFGSLVFLLMPVYSKLLLIFGIPELLMLNILALSCVVFLVKGKIGLGLISIALGFLLGYVGIDENNAPRLTFGYSYLDK